MESRSGTKSPSIPVWLVLVQSVPVQVGHHTDVKHKQKAISGYLFYNIMGRKCCFNVFLISLSQLTMSDEIGIELIKTIHVTASLQGGVVRDPW